MVMSMTGYGIDSFHLEGTTVTVEIRSVNSRYLDFIPKVPRSFHDLEIEMKEIIQTYFHRGRVELYISISGNQLVNRTLTVDWKLMDEFFDQLKEVKERYHLSGDIPISIITTMEELFMIQEVKTDSDDVKPLLLDSIEKASKQVIASRKSEGTFLMKDILSRIKEMEMMLEKVEARKETVYVHYHNRIRQRIEEHIGKAIEMDQVQLMQEIALLAEKGDITEEITRLFSHLHHFNRIVRGENPVGRKLDFITQEMHREVNTIGSKSVDSEISEWVVKLKSSIEKIKEQVQNIE